MTWVTLIDGMNQTSPNLGKGSRVSKIIEVMMEISCINRLRDIIFLYDARTMVKLILQFKELVNLRT